MLEPFGKARPRRGQGLRSIVSALGLVLLAVCGMCPQTVGAQAGGPTASSAPTGGADTAVAEGPPAGGPGSPTAGDAPELLESNISVSSAPDVPPENEIRIAGHAIDAREREVGEEPQQKWFQPVQREGKAATLDIRPRDRAPYLVTLRSTAMQGPRQQIARLGGVIAAADAPSATFVVFMEPAVKAKIAKLDEVRFVRPWLPEDRLSEALATKLAKLLSAGGGGAAAGVSQADQRPAAAQPIQLLVRLFPGESPAEVISTVKQADSPAGKGAVISGVGPKGQSSRGWMLKLSTAASTVPRIAALPSVWRIDLDLPATVHNDHAIKIVRASEVQITHHLTGEGQVIGHADTGIDIGANDDTLHEDLRGRIAVAIARGRPPTPSGSPGDWSDLSGHGTHTAASMVGSGAASDGAYRGMAPGATLVHQSLDDAAGKLVLPTYLGELYEEAYKAKARIHCDSWGFASDKGGGYGEGEDLDAWAWNSGKPRDMLIVCSAGNGGSASRTITPPATAKNCLTVGASTTDRNGLGDAAEVYERSARGPTADNRIKPDLVAPGAWIASARTQAEKIVWHASPDQPDGWVAPPPFSWSVNRGRSGSHSWHYAREEGSTQTDRLESPPFSLPMVGRPLVLEVALAGRIGDGYTVLAQISAGGGDWEPLKPVQSVGDEWETQTFKIGDTYQGKNDLRVGIEISAAAAGAGGIDLSLDGFRITTLETWGYLADAGLIDHGDPRDGMYDFDGGTSMAAPMVCGGAALVRQFFEQEFHVLPSAELVKATLINGARPLGTRSVPNFDEGWGRLDVENAIYPGAGKKLLIKDGTALSEKKTDSTQFTVTDSAELRLTLAWCDPPGDRLTNILGLVLYDPHGEPHFPPGASADLPDRRNNVQRIVVDTAEPGAWRADVTASTIAGSDTPVPQPFALVISGAVQAAPAGRRD